MKSLFYIVGLVMLCMSFIPCSDAKECDPPMVETTVSAVNGHQQHSHADEACAPFCICSCCAATACCTAISKPQLEAEPFFPAKNALYNDASMQDVHHSIWQPPRKA